MQSDVQYWKIYLDTCCLSRLFDPSTQERIIQEAEAVRHIFTYCFSGHWYWISSKVVADEVEQTPDVEKRTQIKILLDLAHQLVSVGTREISRGLELESLGFKKQDALHLACAESGEVDLFLTTDDGLLRGAKRNDSLLRVQVENPYVWFQEVTRSAHLRNDR